MAEFGKLNFSTSFKPTSAFPLDARCYFTDLASAEAAAATAEEVGSTNTIYYFGMKLLVDDGETSKWYEIQRDGTLADAASYVPIRGVDYWTEEDKEEIKKYLDEELLGGAW